MTGSKLDCAGNILPRLLSVEPEEMAGLRILFSSSEDRSKMSSCAYAEGAVLLLLLNCPGSLSEEDASLSRLTSLASFAAASSLAAASSSEDSL